MKNKVLPLVISGLLGLGLLTTSYTAFADDGVTLKQVLEGPQRSAEHKKLDTNRQPDAALNFFKLKPNQKIIEVWPGDGWYTEILAPYLKSGGGGYTTAVEPSTSDERKKRNSAFLNKLADDGDTYGDARLITFDPPKSNIRPVGGVDLVFSNGNVNTWIAEGTADGAFSAFYLALKSGGVLGIINPANSGVSSDTIIAKAKAAGFTADGEQKLGNSGDKALRFVKPADAPVPNDVVKLVRAE